MRDPRDFRWTIGILWGKTHKALWTPWFGIDYYHRGFQATTGYRLTGWMFHLWPVKWTGEYEPGMQLHRKCYDFTSKEEEVWVWDNPPASGHDEMEANQETGKQGAIQ